MDKSIKRILVSFIFVFVCSVIVAFMLLNVGVDFEIETSDKSNKNEQTRALDPDEEYNDNKYLFTLEEASFFESVCGIWNSGEIFWNVYLETLGKPNVGFTVFNGVVAISCWFAPIILVASIVWVAVFAIVSFVAIIIILVHVKRNKLSSQDEKEANYFYPFSYATGIWIAPAISLLSVWSIELFYNSMLSFGFEKLIFDIPFYVRAVPTTPLNHLFVFIIALLVFYIGKSIIGRTYGGRTVKEKSVPTDVEK